MFAPLTREGRHPRTAARDPGGCVTTGPTMPSPPTTNSRRRTLAMPRLQPRSIQLCIHCRHNPAGFWVSGDSDQTVRRPWCLSCCQDLDPACHRIRPFDS
jgi:hypothetical protein